MAVSTWCDECHELSTQTTAEAMRNGISPGVRRSRVERRIGNVNSELSKFLVMERYTLYSQERDREGQGTRSKEQGKMSQAQATEVQYFQAACATGKPTTWTKAAEVGGKSGKSFSAELTSLVRFYPEGSRETLKAWLDGREWRDSKSSREENILYSQCTISLSPSLKLLSGLLGKTDQDPQPFISFFPFSDKSFSFHPNISRWFCVVDRLRRSQNPIDIIAAFDESMSQLDTSVVSF